MVIITSKNTLKIEDVIDYIKQNNIHEDKKVMFNFEDKVVPVTAIDINDDFNKKIMSIKINKDNTNFINALNISHLIKCIKGHEQDIPVSVLENDYKVKNLKFRVALVSVKTINTCEKTGNLILGY